MYIKIVKPVPGFIVGRVIAEPHYGRWHMLVKHLQAAIPCDLNGNPLDDEPESKPKPLPEPVPDVDAEHSTDESAEVLSDNAGPSEAATETSPKRKRSRRRAASSDTKLDRDLGK